MVQVKWQYSGRMVSDPRFQTDPARIVPCILGERFMVIWLKRWLAYVLIPAGLVLLFVPLSTHRMGEAERDVLFLEIRETLADPEKAEETGSPPSEPDSAENPLQQMKKRWKFLSEAETLAAAPLNPYGYPRIQLQDLTTAPALARQLRIIRVAPSNFPRPIRLESVPIEEWDAFRAAAGITSANNAFQYGKFIFEADVKSADVYGPVEVKHLKIGCKAAGGIFLLVGLFALIGTYAPAFGGISIGKRSAIILWDIIIILLGGPFTLWLVDMLLALIFQTAPDWGEDFAKGMGVFWVALTNPAVALFVTATSLQTIRITPENIQLKGLFGASSAAWPEVESVSVSQMHSPRKVGGKWAPHRVARVLVISAGDVTLRVMEPPYSSTKKQIIGALMEHAPEKVKPSIEQASKEWLSYW